MELLSKLLLPINKEHLEGYVIIAIPSSVNPSQFIVMEEVGRKDTAKINNLGYMNLAKLQELLALVGGKQDRSINGSGAMRITIELE